MYRPLYVTCIFVFTLYLGLFNVGCSKNSPGNLNGNDNFIHEGEPSISKTKSSTKPTYTTIEWTDLLPTEDLEALENPPDYLSEIEDGSESDQLTSQLKTELTPGINSTDSALEDRYQQALTSNKIRPEFNGRPIRIPGFIVPLEFDDHQTITTFFLVPFFGACIHMPPPPPNQIIYAEYEPGIRLEALYDPFWITGTLSTSLVENDTATAAYSMSVSIIEPYTDTNSQEWGDTDQSEPFM